MPDYESNTWTDEAPGELPLRYRIRNADGSTLVEGAMIDLVTEVTPGTPLSAQNMNHIEQGIATLQAQVNTGAPKIFNAKGDLIVALGANLAARLGVGPNGQVLTAKDSLEIGMEWALPWAQDRFAAKGDLLVGTGVDMADRVGVGANGTVLTADSNQTKGVKWSPIPTQVPIGGIILWSGSEALIPSGWHLCDGTAGTPNLQDRFVIGAGSTYDPGDTGGSATKNLQHTHSQGNTGSESAHTHTLSANTGSAGAHTHAQSGPTGAGSAHSHGQSGSTADGGNHTHGLSGSVGQASGNGNAMVGGDIPIDYAIAGHTHSFSGSAASAGAHAHSLSGNTGAESAHTHTLPANTGSNGSHNHTQTGPTGSAGAHAHTNPATNNGGSATQNIMPPYYALCYIMRVS